MPSDSVAGFLSRSQASRVLFPEQVEQLIRQPDIPHSDLSAFCDYLLARGVLTRFQVSAIRESRNSELTYAGYAVIDEIGPCPGGKAYKALHPSLKTQIVLRRILTQWLKPNDNAHEYLNRAKMYGMLSHNNMIPLLDAGLYQDEIYLVIDQPPDADNLEQLAKEVGGAMPGFLAAEYGRAMASVLAMIHERGGVHGEVRPGNLVVSPLARKKNAEGVERRRPAPNAVVRLAEVGLIPWRPPATQFYPDSHVTAYLPPERMNSGVPTPSGDIYGLGASLYFLLSGRPPFDALEPNELFEQVRRAEPTALSALRPDLPQELVELVTRMMSKHAERRPRTAADVEKELAVFCREQNTQVKAATATVPVQDVSHSTDVSPPVYVIPTTEEVPASEGFDNWGVGSEALSSAHASAAPAPRKREMTDEEKKRSRRLLVLGAVLHLTWISLGLAWLLGAFSSTPKPDTTPTPVKKESPTPAKKNKKNNSNG